MTAPSPDARASPPWGERRRGTLCFQPPRCSCCASGGCGRRWRMGYLQAASVPCGGAKIKTLVAFSTLARTDLARLTPPNALPITRRDHASAGMRGSGECPERQRGRTVNPLAYAFVGSSPTAPTTQEVPINQCFLGRDASHGLSLLRTARAI